MSERLFQDLLGWLAEQKSLTEGRQIVKLELGYAPRGFREEQLCSWVRKDEPDWFESQALTEQLIHKVLEIATQHADSYSSGEHRYVLRSFQHLAGISVRAFKIATSMSSSAGIEEQEPGMGLMALGSKAAGTFESMASVLTQNNQSLMRTNQLMFESTFRTLTGMIQGSNEESAALKAENATLRRENEELRSNRYRDEFDMETQREERDRKNRTGDMLNNLLPVIAAKVMGGDGGKSAASPLGLLVRQLKESLRPEQIQQMAALLEQAQLAIFIQILQMVSEPEAQAGQAA